MTAYIVISIAAVLHNISEPENKDYFKVHGLEEQVKYCERCMQDAVAIDVTTKSKLLHACRIQRKHFEAVGQHLVITFGDPPDSESAEIRGNNAPGSTSTRPSDFAGVEQVSDGDEDNIPLPPGLTVHNTSPSDRSATQHLLSGAFTAFEDRLVSFGLCYCP